jgi:hypothetical protein
MTKIKGLTAHLKVRPFNSLPSSFSAACKGVLHPLPDTGTLELL